MSIADNKAIVAQMFADPAERRGNPLDLLADDVCWVITGQWSWARTFTGRDAVVKELLAHVASLLEGRMRTVAYNYVAEGDTVVVEAKGDSVTKTGLRYDNDYCMVFTLRDGLVTRIREYQDTALVERVMGPPPAVAGGR